MTAFQIVLARCSLLYRFAVGTSSWLMTAIVATDWAVNNYLLLRQPSFPKQRHQPLVILIARKPQHEGRCDAADAQLQALCEAIIHRRACFLCIPQAGSGCGPHNTARQEWARSRQPLAVAQAGRVITRDEIRHGDVIVAPEIGRIAGIEL